LARKLHEIILFKVLKFTRKIFYQLILQRAVFMHHFLVLNVCIKHQPNSTNPESYIPCSCTVVSIGVHIDFGNTRKIEITQFKH